MNLLEPWRDAAAVARLVEDLQGLVTRPWTIMEVCGGQTRTILRYGIQDLLPTKLRLAHGPGCPVCVTPVAVIDAAIALTARPEVVLCSFGDMLWVPGSTTDLMQSKAAGGDVRVVYSPLDALELAQLMPGREVIFFAVGFETTIPAVALAIQLADERQIANFSVLLSHRRVPPAMAALLAAEDDAYGRIDAFLAAGHVCSVMGVAEYMPLAEHYRRPIVVTGFEPLDILQGIYLAVRQLEQGRYLVENQYKRVVGADGNHRARELVAKLFEVGGQDWRGIGLIADSGLHLRPAYVHRDAAKRFAGVTQAEPASAQAGDRACQAGAVLTGRIKPNECPAFAKTCTPRRPLGAPMVATEGVCAAYFSSSR